MQGNQSTVDPAEVAKFEAMAAEWWDLEGKFKPLHMLNPCRLDYITQQIASEFGRNLKEALPFQGLRILDIGCGGGLLCEPFARLGAQVTGIDASKNNIEVAKIHAQKTNLQIQYLSKPPEEIKNKKFDVILCMEVIEHVDKVNFFVER